MYSIFSRSISVKKKKKTSKSKPTFARYIYAEDEKKLSLLEDYDGDLSNKMYSFWDGRIFLKQVNYPSRYDPVAPDGEIPNSVVRHVKIVEEIMEEEPKDPFAGIWRIGKPVDIDNKNLGESLITVIDPHMVPEKFDEIKPTEELEEDEVFQTGGTELFPNLATPNWQKTKLFKVVVKLFRDSNFKLAQDADWTAVFERLLSMLDSRDFTVFSSACKYLVELNNCRAVPDSVRKEVAVKLYEKLKPNIEDNTKLKALQTIAAMNLRRPEDYKLILDNTRSNDVDVASTALELKRLFEIKEQPRREFRRLFDRKKSSKLDFDIDKMLDESAKRKKRDSTGSRGSIAVNEEDQEKIKDSEVKTVKKKGKGKTKAVKEEIDYEAEKQRLIKYAEEEKLKKLAEEEKRRKLAEEGKLKLTDEQKLKLTDEQKLKLTREKRLKLKAQKRLKLTEEERIKLRQEEWQKLTEEQRLKLRQGEWLKLTEEERLKLIEEQRLKLTEEEWLKLTEEQRLKLTEEEWLKLAEEEWLKLTEEEWLKLTEEEWLKLTEEEKLKLAEEEWLKLTEEEKLKLAEEEWLKLTEEEKLKLTEEEWLKLTEEERLKLTEEEWLKLTEEEKLKLAEEERLRKLAEKERLRKLKGNLEKGGELEEKDMDELLNELMAEGEEEEEGFDMRQHPDEANVKRRKMLGKYKESEGDVWVKGRGMVIPDEHSDIENYNEEFKEQLDFLRTVYSSSEEDIADNMDISEEKDATIVKKREATTKKKPTVEPAMKKLKVKQQELLNQITTLEETARKKSTEVEEFARKHKLEQLSPEELKKFKIAQKELLEIGKKVHGLKGDLKSLLDIKQIELEEDTDIEEVDIKESTIEIKQFESNIDNLPLNKFVIMEHDFVKYLKRLRDKTKKPVAKIPTTEITKIWDLKVRSEDVSTANLKIDLQQPQQAQFRRPLTIFKKTGRGFRDVDPMDRFMDDSTFQGSIQKKEFQIKYHTKEEPSKPKEKSKFQAKKKVSGFLISDAFKKPNKYEEIIFRSPASNTMQLSEAFAIQENKPRPGQQKYVRHRKVPAVPTVLKSYETEVFDLADEEVVNALTDGITYEQTPLPEKKTGDLVVESVVESKEKVEEKKSENLPVESVVERKEKVEEKKSEDLPVESVVERKEKVEEKKSGDLVVKTEEKIKEKKEKDTGRFQVPHILLQACKEGFEQETTETSANKLTTKQLLAPDSPVWDAIQESEETEIKLPSIIPIDYKGFYHTSTGKHKGRIYGPTKYEKRIGSPPSYQLSESMQIISTAEEKKMAHERNKRQSKEKAIFTSVEPSIPALTEFKLLLLSDRESEIPGEENKKFQKKHPGFKRPRIMSLGDLMQPFQGKKKGKPIEVVDHLEISCKDKKDIETDKSDKPKKPKLLHQILHDQLLQRQTASKKLSGEYPIEQYLLESTIFEEITTRKILHESKLSPTYKYSVDDSSKTDQDEKYSSVEILKNIHDIDINTAKYKETKTKELAMRFKKYEGKQEKISRVRYLVKASPHESFKSIRRESFSLHGTDLYPTENEVGLYDLKRQLMVEREKIFTKTIKTLEEKVKELETDKVSGLKTTEIQSKYSAVLPPIISAKAGMFVEDKRPSSKGELKMPDVSTQQSYAEKPRLHRLDWFPEDQKLMFSPKYYQSEKFTEDYRRTQSKIYPAM